MPKLIIEVTGTSEELNCFTGALSDGGGEDIFYESLLEGVNACPSFDYSKCFPAHGYDPKVDGPDKRITVTMETREDGE